MNQKQQILNYLKNGQWHCMANPGFYMKDDRKRISELRDEGYMILSKPCDGRCGVKHNARILMRKLYDSLERNTNSNKIQPRDQSLPLNTGKEIRNTPSYANVGDTTVQLAEKKTSHQVLQTLW